MKQKKNTIVKALRKDLKAFESLTPKTIYFLIVTETIIQLYSNS